MTRAFLWEASNSGALNNPGTFFDVGANLGQTINEMREVFPQVKIHAFEPTLATYTTLSEKNRDMNALELHQLALDRKVGTQKFLSESGSVMNHIVKGDAEPGSFEIVQTLTGDRFCQDHKIESIDFLKIDTEGFDLDVLSGFSHMLLERKINFIQVECTTSLDNHFHVHLERFIHFLHPFGYRLYGLYDFARQVYVTRQKLNGIWFCNAVFVAEVENPRLRTDGRN